MAANGIFCLEGEWDPDLRKRVSVLPTLEYLERLGEIKAIHRDVAKPEELRHYLSKWSQRRYDDYRVLFLATHGGKGELEWSPGNGTSLSELAEILGDSAHGRYIYFGSCLTLFDDKESRKFVDATGAAAVLGYRKEVGFIEGAAFETVLLPWMAQHAGRPETLFKRLMARHGGLAALFKFVMTTQKETLRSQDSRL